MDTKVGVMRLQPELRINLHARQAELSPVVGQRARQVAAGGLQAHGEELQRAQARPARRGKQKN